MKGDEIASLGPLSDAIRQFAAERRNTKEPTMSFAKFLKTTDLPALKKAYLAAKKAYYNNGNSTLTDAEFDKLEEALRKQAPEWSGLKKTGVKVEKLGKKSEVTLAVPCPSLDKVVAEKPEAYERWINRTIKTYGSRFRASEKIDGSALEAEYLNGKLVELATRGDGVIGKSIMFLAPYLNIPQTIPKLPGSKRVVVRCEAAMPVHKYNAKWAGQYDSARALASALLNRQDASPALKDLDIVALRVLDPKYGLHEGLEWLARDCDFKIARGKVYDFSATGKYAMNCETLANMLEDVRAVSNYECDGLVIFSNSPNLETTAERPDYARAFKVNDEADALETVVTGIVWKASAFGVLVPKAQIKPIKFGGVTVKNASIHNPRWAIDRGIGVGAKVKVLRSGDIIPKIVSVIKPAEFKLPKHSEYGQYQWDATKTTIVLVDASENDEVAMHRLSRFFKTLDMEQLAKGLAEKLITAGIRTTGEVLHMTEADWRKLPGVRSMAPKYVAQTQRVLSGEFTLPVLMKASGCFAKGIGETRLDTLQAHDPQMLSKDFRKMAATKKEAIDLVAKVPGCGPAFAELYVEGWPKFWQWVLKNQVRWSVPAKKRSLKKGPLTGQAVSWTGYRSPAEEERVNELGGEVVGFGSKTTILLYSPSGKSSSKVDKAREKGIEVTTFDRLVKGK